MYESDEREPNLEQIEHCQLRSIRCQACRDGLVLIKREAQSIVVQAPEKGVLQACVNVTFPLIRPVKVQISLPNRARASSELTVSKRPTTARAGKPRSYLRCLDRMHDQSEDEGKGFGISGAILARLTPPIVEDMAFRLNCTAQRSTTQ